MKCPRETEHNKSQHRDRNCIRGIFSSVPSGPRLQRPLGTWSGRGDGKKKMEHSEGERLPPEKSSDFHRSFLCPICSQIYPDKFLRSIPIYFKIMFIISKKTAAFSLGSLYSRCDRWTSSISISWDLAKKADLQVSVHPGSQTP